MGFDAVGTGVLTGAGGVSFRDLRIAGKGGERFAQFVQCQEKIQPRRETQVNLIGGDELRNFDEERTAFLKPVQTADGERIVARRSGVSQGQLGGTVGGAVVVVPTLREGFPGRRGGLFDGLIETDENAVFPRLESDGNRSSSGEPHPLKTAVDRSVVAPAEQPGDAELTAARRKRSSALAFLQMSARRSEMKNVRVGFHSIRLSA